VSNFTSLHLGIFPRLGVGIEPSAIARALLYLLPGWSQTIDAIRCTYSEASVILSGVFRFVLRIENAQSKDPSLLDPEQSLGILPCFWPTAAVAADYLSDRRPWEFPSPGT